MINRNGTQPKLKKIDSNDYSAEHGPGALKQEALRLLAESKRIKTTEEMPLDNLDMSEHEPIPTEGETYCPVSAALTPRDLIQYNVEDDPDALFANRWLCRGGSCFLIGSTGAGKSSLAMQAAVCWGLGETLFGITPRRPLRSLVLQAENDPGDLSEMFRGVLNGLGHAGRLDELQSMLTFVSESAKCGDDFMPWAAGLIHQHKPDLVWIDPLFAFLGGNVSDQAAVSKFLRNGLGAIAQQTGVTWIVIHHANKPPKDPKPISGGVGSDLSYMGSGSAELANWARAVLTLRELEDGLFEMRAAKRGRRAGLLDAERQPTTEIFLAHGKVGICWERADPPAVSGIEGAKKAQIAEILERMKTPPEDGRGWRHSALISLIVEIRGGKPSGAKAWLQRTLSPHLCCTSGIYAARGCTVADGCK